VGLGYIGLPTACLLALKGFKVVGVDINESHLNMINSGIPPIQEPNLDQYLSKAINKNNFKAVSTIEPADIFIICVPTPFIKKDLIPKPDLSYLYKAADDLIPILNDGNTIILESTSPVGTTETLASYISKKRSNLSNLKIGYCPERVLPGNIFYELINNDRIIGGIDLISTENISNFYRSFVEGEVIETNSRTAEMCKLSENSFRDTNIAFANSLSILCDEKEIDVWELIDLANRHPRVNILNPGPGVGGHCIAVDPWFLVSDASNGVDLIHQSRKVNDSKPKWVQEKIINTAESISIKKKSKPVIGCFGLTFKPDIDDIRESPAIVIYSQLRKKGYEVKAIDPNLSKNKLKNIDLISMEQAFTQIDIFVILVKHKEFLEKTFIQKLKTKNYLDFCGLTFA